MTVWTFSARTLFVGLILGVVLGCGKPLSPSAEETEEFLAPGQLHEVASARGLKFRFRSDVSNRKLMYETLGGGVVLFDADGDRDLDVFVPGGGSAAASTAQSAYQGFFRNDGRATFENVTVEVGLVPLPGDAFTLAAAVSDVDADGDLDLYVTSLGPNRLYLNDGSGHFVRVDQAGGAAGDAWSAAAVFFDADADGDDDLYVANYVEYDPDDELPCTLGGLRIYCTPDLFASADNQYYRNDGDGGFTEFSGRSGVQASAGKSLAVVAVDVDRDLDLDLYVANDTNANTLWINDGAGYFQDEALIRGVALGRDGREEASMGIAVADLDRDGDLDAVVPNFSGEVYSLYRHEPGGFFTEIATSAGLAATTASLLGFGVIAEDFDLDGWVDLAFANGHINDLADDLLVATTFRQPNLLLRNVGGRFRPWPEREGDFSMPNVARGIASGDLDGDGDVDLVVSRLDQPLGLFLNAGQPVGAWIAAAPRLSSGAPAFGAEVRLRLSDGTERYGQLVSGGSYGSQSEPILRFGLGEETQPSALIIRWLSGAEQQIDHPEIRQVHYLAPP